MRKRGERPIAGDPWGAESPYCGTNRAVRKVPGGNDSLDGTGWTGRRRWIAEMPRGAGGSHRSAKGEVLPPPFSAVLELEPAAADADAAVHQPRDRSAGSRKCRGLASPQQFVAKPVVASFPVHRVMSVAAIMQAAGGSKVRALKLLRHDPLPHRQGPASGTAGSDVTGTRSSMIRWSGASRNQQQEERGHPAQATESGLSVPRVRFTRRRHAPGPPRVPAVRSGGYPAPERIG